MCCSLHTGWIKTWPVQKLLVRVKFTGNPYSYRTCISVNGRYWNTCKLVFLGSLRLTLVSMWTWSQFWNGRKYRLNADHDLGLLRPKVPLHTGCSVGIEAYSNQTLFHRAHLLNLRWVLDSLLHLSTITCCLEIPTKYVNKILAYTVSHEKNVSPNFCP